MRNISFYHKDTGLFNGSHLTTSDDTIIAQNTPIDHIAIDGHHDYLSKRVANGVVVEYQPPADTAEHAWNSETKRWELNAGAVERKKQRPMALKRIAELESAQHRIVREGMMQLMLGQDTKQVYQHLAGIEDEIATLRPIVRENF